MALKQKKRHGFLECSWTASCQDIVYFIDRHGMHISNNGDSDGYLRCVIPDNGVSGFVLISFKGFCTSGNSGILYCVNEYNCVLGETTLESEALFELPSDEEHALLIKVFPRSSICVTYIDSVSCEENDPVKWFVSRNLTGSVAFITPTYPAQENRYLCAFVHSRVKSYLSAKVKCDVICAYDYDGYCSYEIEGVRVLRIPLDKLHTVLSVKNYQVIISHFFDLRYAGVFDVCDLGNTLLIIKTHGPETRYWDYPEFTTPYFQDKVQLTEKQIREFKKLDEVIDRYNGKDNVVWFFPSGKLKERSEELLNIRFNRYLVIPDLVDEHHFAYQPKDADLRGKIFFNRKFDNIATYAIDISVQVILELSKRPCFSDMQFSIYGTGDYYHELVEPIKQFENVRLYPFFLERNEIPKVHSENGIGLFATRFDTQGVAMGEAAMSGLAVVSSKIDAAEYFLPNDKGLLADVEDPVSYADIIEGLYNDSERFLECSAACHEKIYDLCRSEVTVEKEISFVKSKLSNNLLQRVRDHMNDIFSGQRSKFKH